MLCSSSVVSPYINSAASESLFRMIYGSTIALNTV